MRPRYWFVRKQFGYGWVPATWEGWLVLTLFFILFIPLPTLLLAPPINAVKMALFVLATGILVTALIVVCLIKGEKPRWQWGRHRDD